MTHTRVTAKHFAVLHYKKSLNDWY